ncbi:MAG: hypothetical protein QXD69_04975 [Candidatus Bathyarchaeia archaeon]
MKFIREKLYRVYISVILFIPIPALIGFYIGWIVRNEFDEPLRRLLPFIGGMLGFILGCLIILWIIRSIILTKPMKK